jgi:hypothetical protein
MIFTVPILIAPFDEDCGFIEGCASGNKAPISGCDIQQGGGGGGCDAGLAIGATVVGGVIGGIFTVAIAS